jgi:hypothetical protein
MGHYARIDENNIVQEVLVVEDNVIRKGLLGHPAQWIKTSYNMYAGEHRLGGTPLRKNFAGIGYTYDAGKDAFIPPKQFDSWVLNEETCLWEAPIPMPQDGKYIWSEPKIKWVNIPPEPEDGKTYQFSFESESWIETEITPPSDPEPT